MKRYLRKIVIGIVVAVSITPAAHAQDRLRAKAVDARHAALQALARSAGGHIASHFAPETRAYDFVRATGARVIARDDASKKPEARAFAFLRRYGAVVGMSAADRASLALDGLHAAPGSVLRVHGVETDMSGKVHVRLDQAYDGIEVFGAQLVVHMNAAGITAVNGNFVPGITTGATPAIARNKAVSVARALVAKRGRNLDLKVPETHLSIFRTGLIEGVWGHNVLVWSVDVAGRGVHERVWVDAKRGLVIQRMPLNETAKQRYVYSPQYDRSDPNRFVLRKEGDPDSHVPPVDNLYEFTGEVYDFYHSAFGRDAWNGKGAAMRTVYLVNDRCPNAYWNGSTTNYCPGFDHDDVVAHEWTHAVTQTTHGLIYLCQPGALNESYSDIFGETIDLLNGRDGPGGSNNAEPYPNGQRWLVGEDLGQAQQQQEWELNQQAHDAVDQVPLLDLVVLRDMWDPIRATDPGKVSDIEYVCDFGDGGGVHTNSGVPNHAYAMLVDGKTYNGVTIRGIGLTKAAHIYYQAMTAYQVPATKFADHEQALKASCNDLRGINLKELFTGAPSGKVITAGDCDQVAKVARAVEFSKPPTCKFTPLLADKAPPVCPGASRYFSEDFESGMDGWTTQSTGLHPEWTKPNWKVRGGLPSRHSGYAAYALEPDAGSCESGDDASGSFAMTSKEFRLPADITDPFVRFDHWIATERGYDGGNVKISVNGGDFEALPRESFLSNAPNVDLNGNVDPLNGSSTNPMAGETAWSGADGGEVRGSWGTSVATLAARVKPGDAVRLRLDFGVDCGGGVTGWFVDNIVVYSCPVLEVPADVSITSNPSGAYTVSWTRPDGATGPDSVQESTLSCAPLLADDAEGGLGKWTTATKGTGALEWRTSTAKPEHDGTAFWASAAEGATNASAILTWSEPIPIRAPTTLTFSDWSENEGDDEMIVETSLDGQSWEKQYVGIRNDIAPALEFLTEPLFARSVDLSKFIGKTIRLRFRFFAGPDDRAGTTPLGWYVDDIKVYTESWKNIGTTTATSLTIPGRAKSGTYCYRVSTAYVLHGERAVSGWSAPASVRVKGGVVKPVVKGERRTRTGHLPATGVEDAVMPGLVLLACAAALARRRPAARRR